MDRRLDDPNPFEDGVHTFTGIIRTWRTSTAELHTDSGLSVQIHIPQGQPPVPEGARVTVTARKYKPRYLITAIQPR
jgi:hypothetical protein